MKKLLALAAALLLALPAMAAAEAPDVRFEYNGQAYECTYSAFRKCCTNADTSYDFWLEPAGASQLRAVNIAIPSSARTGDRYSLRAGEAVEWLTFYADRDGGLQHYVSMPGSLFGTGLVSEKDFYELTVHSVEFRNGLPYVKASVRASFLDGSETFEIDFDLKLR